MKRSVSKILLAGVSAVLLVGGSFILPETVTEVSAQETDSTEEGFYLNSEKVNEIWVGDSVCSDIQVDGWHHKTVYKIIEGDSVTVDERICAVKEGYAKVEAEYWGYSKNYHEEGEEMVLLDAEILEINVVKRPAEIEFSDIPKSIKLGQQIEYTIKNANYGSHPAIYISEPNNSFGMPGYGGESNIRNWPGYIYTAVKYEYDGTIAENCNNLATIAFYPGTYTYGMYADMRSAYDESAEPIGTGSLVVEEPTIETNAPETIKPGTTLEFKTSLGNLYLEDEMTAKLFKAIYEPEITILEGADCVEQSDKIYEDMSTLESLKFTKNGTVKLQIKYVADVDYEEFSSEPEIYYPLDGNFKPELYTVEKIITITVSDKEVEDKAETADGVISQEEAEKLEAEAVIEGVEVNTKLEVNTIADTDDDFKNVIKDETVEGKNFAIADLKLVKDGVAVQPNGKIKIKLSLMENIKGAKYVEVFRLNNTTKKLDSLGIVPVENGKFTFETDHFSTYVFMEASKPAEVPNTSDITDMMAPTLILMCGGLFVIGAICSRRKSEIE